MSRVRSLAFAVGALLVGMAVSGCASTDDGGKAAAPDTPAVQQVADDTVKTREAACNCGQLRVTTVGPDPERISLCPCPLCQRQSGSAFAIQARFPKEQVTIEGKSTSWKFPIRGAKPVDFRNCAEGGAEFHFCPECGSTVWYTSDLDDARIGIKIGAFADPTFPAPRITGFTEFRHPWTQDLKAAGIKEVQ
jgi:hypothetical protein